MNTQPNLLDMLAPAPHDTDVLSHYTIPENWLQGRTTYGGLSSSLCLDAILKQHADLPPLRSAMITFVGPVHGAVSVQTSVLRRGKSVANISARLSNEVGIGVESVFSFGASRESRLDQNFLDAVSACAPDESEDFFGGRPGPSFAQNFDCRLVEGARPITGSTKHDMLLWIRHKEHEQYCQAALDPCVTLLAIADMPPPAVLPMFETPAPISSMTWMVNFVDVPTTDPSGWWLLRSTAENAKDGYSSQNMYVWDAQGRLVITGRQSIAIFY